jgi:hypothetical protein
MVTMTLAEDAIEGEVQIQLENGQLLFQIHHDSQKRLWLYRPDLGLGYQLPANTDLLSLPKAKPDA